MSVTPTFGRYAEILVDQMTAEQKEGYRFLVEGPRGRLPGPYKVWVHNPKQLRAAAPLGEPFTPGHTSLTEREQVVYELATTLANGRLVSQGLYDRAIKALGHESITDVVVLMGYYTAVSLTMNVYDVPAGTPGLAR